jgi:protein gp37
MANKTGIEWTDSTWNPIRGCTPVSPGCKNCYAAKVAKRFSFSGGAYEGLVRINAAGERTDDWNGNIHFVEKHLLDPLKWKDVSQEIDLGEGVHRYERRPRRIFVNSMSDLFHENVTRRMLLDIAGVMVLGYWHTYQILTKRPERAMAVWPDVVSEAVDIMRSVQDRGGIADRRVFRSLDMRRRDKVAWTLPLPNVWLGVSVENQAAADERIPLLLQTPAAVRFLSCEPLLGNLEISRWFAAACGDAPWLDWVICGGESEHGARPMLPDWARSLRDQCQAAGVPFFFKQWGKHYTKAFSMTTGKPVFRQFTDYQHWLNKASPAWVNGGLCIDAAGKICAKGSDFQSARYPVTIMHRVPKKVAGSLLDGRVYRQFPEVSHVGA